MVVYIGADHRGFHLKQELMNWLAQDGYTVVDCGNSILDEVDDFVDFGAEVGRRVAHDENGVGIAICGSGAGMLMAVNKIPGARCAYALNVEVVEHACLHEHANAVALASDYQSLSDVKPLVMALIKTQYLPVERFERRLAKLKLLEAKG